MEFKIRSGSNVIITGQSYTKLFRMEKSVMMDLATSRNCVIVGRCPDCVLRKYGIPDENMLNVFIYSPIEKRLSNCKAELNLDDPGEAYTYLTKVDKAREDFYKHYTKHKFSTNKFRHLLIDSSMAEFDKVADIITNSAKVKFGIE